VIAIGGAANYASALGKADITIVQPIISLTGVIAAVTGVVFLKEKVRPIEWAGISLIIAGVVVVSLAEGGQSAQSPTNFGLFVFTLVSVVLIGCSFLIKRIGASLEFSLALAAGLNYGLANLMGKLLTQRAIIEVGAPFSLGRGDVWISLLTDYPAWIILATNILGGALLQTAFANGRASVVSPIVTIISNLLPIVGALAIFGEQVRLLHAIGIFIVLVGTSFLALRQDKKPATV
jgi:drug/metabolite transporter (DMT)-like permease